MGITKYKTAAGRYISATVITPVEVERESAQCVWINGRKQAKESTWDRLHDSWEEAHAYLLERAKAKLEGARIELQRAQGFHGNVLGLKPPQQPK